MTRADVRAMTDLAIEAGKLKSHNELLLAGCQEWKRLHAENAQTIAEQQREIERLKAALDDYALHKAICSVWSPRCGDYSGIGKCTCGLDEVLK